MRGAKIIHSDTLPIYNHHEPIGTLLNNIPVFYQYDHHSLHQAISQLIHLDTCWYMVNNHSQIAISLIKSIIITDITIKHVSKDEVEYVGSTLKEMELWG